MGEGSLPSMEATCNEPLPPQILPPDVALRRIMKGRFSMINYEKYIAIYINANYTDSRGRSPFQLSRKSFSIMPAYGWGLR